MNSCQPFDDRRLVNNAGLILPATLALHLGLPELVDRHLDLGDASGRANTGAKIMTLVASALAGGDCIDDADALRTGGTAGALGCAASLYIFQSAGPGKSSSVAPWHDCEPCHFRPDGACLPLTRPPAN